MQLALAAMVISFATGTSPQSASGADVFRDCEQCPQMVLIPGGSYLRGAPEAERERHDVMRGSFPWDSEQPVRRVTVAAFALGKFEVTIAEFAAFVAESRREASGCRWFVAGRMDLDPARSWRKPGGPVGDQHPVSCVSWDDATAYVQWLASKTGKPYRLVTEAEWEYAARAGATTAWPWGDDPNEGCKHSNLGDASFKRLFPRFGPPDWPAAKCDDGYPLSAPVGSFQANAFGLHDMIGNVWEWVQDCRRESYSGAPIDGSADTSGLLVDCRKRVIRGGSAMTQPPHARLAIRIAPQREEAFYHIGFRVALTAQR